MAVEKKFVSQGIRESQIHDWLRDKFKRADYSHSQIQRTPLGTRIIVWAQKPGLVIGKSGRRVDEITAEIGQVFGLENPMVDVREVTTPLLDAHIVAKRICRALERGIHFKRVGNFYVEKVMEAGAVGVQIEIAGKLAGSRRSRFQKFKKGYIKHAGGPAHVLVDRASAQAAIKPGIVGVKVKIMKEMPADVARRGEV
jgi:small subunit ribosomal protein S3